MGKRSNGMARGDANRNATLDALRAVLPRDHAILGIDLAQLGFSGVTVACEPTGHRWMIVQQLAAGRHLGARRARLITQASACKQQLRDLLEVAWPAVLGAAGDPMASATWLASLSVALAGEDGDLEGGARGRQRQFIDETRRGLGLAAILAETGDPSRFSSARAMVKHAGLAPAENSSGNHNGAATISRRGRPALRLAAWRAVWGALRHNQVYAARRARLTTRAVDKLTTQQADAAIAAALIRQIHAIITTGTPWDAAIAAGLATPSAREVRRTPPPG